MMRVLFLGTGKIGVPSVLALAESGEVELVGVVTQPDRPIGRHQVLHASPIKEAVLNKKIPIFQPEKINAPEVVRELQKLKPDVVAVASYGQILKKGILELGSKGIINIHASLLPKYRGAACIPAAIRSGDKETGVTIMFVEEGVDTGDILLQKSIPIRSDDTSATLEDRLGELSPMLLLEVLGQIKDGKLNPKKQDEKSATYEKKLTKADGEIDWAKSAEEIECHIRAMIPWPNAYTRVEDKMLKIFSAEISNASGKAGEVLKSTEEGILAAAGKGSLLLKEVQLEGKRRMSAEEFSRGHALPKGMLLGNSALQ